MSLIILAILTTYAISGNKGSDEIAEELENESDLVDCQTSNKYNEYGHKKNPEK